MVVLGGGAGSHERRTTGGLTGPVNSFLDRSMPGLPDLESRQRRILETCRIRRGMDTSLHSTDLIDPGLVGRTIVFGEVPRKVKMLFSRTDPASYIIEFT